MISKFDHDSEIFKIAVDFENELLICQWLINFFLLCRWHSDNLHEEKFESNAILWKITYEAIWDKSLEWIKMIFKNKNHSRSSKSQNLTLSRFIHQQDSDKISLERDEMLEDLACESVTNQWKCKNFRSEKIEFAKNVCLSAKSKIVEFCSSHFQIRYSLFDCKTRSILKKLEFESCDDRKSNYCLSQWH